MTIVQLEYLVALSTYGSFSVAAEKCFVTQPSLSAQIKHLEEELGTILVVRSNKKTTLTPAGEQILQQARIALSAFEKVKERAKEIRHEVSGDLHLGIIPTIAPYLVHRISEIFQQKYPQVNLYIYETITDDINSRILRNEFDAGILAEGFSPDHLQQTELCRDPFFAYIPEGNDLCNLAEINISDIRPDKLLLLNEGHCLRKQIVSLCATRLKEERMLKIESGSIETLLRVTQSLKGVTIIPGITLPYLSEEQKKRVRPILDEQAFRTLILASNPYTAHPALIEILKKEVKQLMDV
ncbi:MAG: LysR substrate-binding domain-containing protein [Bacteroidales bacterium]